MLHKSLSTAGLPQEKEMQQCYIDMTDRQINALMDKEGRGGASSLRKLLWLHKRLSTAGLPQKKEQTASLRMHLNIHKRTGWENPIRFLVAITLPGLVFGRGHCHRFVLFRNIRDQCFGG